MTRKTINRKPYTIQDGVTQSLLAGWVNCRQWAKFYLEGWETPGAKEALEFGNLFHWLLEGAYTTIRLTPPLDKFAQDNLKDSVIHGISVMIEKYDFPKSLNPQTQEKILALAEALWPMYWKIYAKDLNREWLAVEGTFDVDWNGFRLRGKRDGVFVGKRKKPWLLETKTTSRIDEGTLDLTLGFDFQNLFYITSAEEEQGGNIAGVMYNVIQRSALRQKKAETFPDYCQRMAEDIRDNPKKYFKRIELLYTKEQKERFKEELLQKLREFEMWLSELHGGLTVVPTYKNERACVGRWNCQYLQACSSNLQTGELFRELK
jgi:hypothetical protein